LSEFYSSTGRLKTAWYIHGLATEMSWQSGGDVDGEDCIRHSFVFRVKSDGAVFPAQHKPLSVMTLGYVFPKEKTPKARRLLREA